MAAKHITADLIRSRLETLVVRVHGDPLRVAARPRPLNAAGAGTLTFCRKGGDDLIRALAGAAGAVVICPDDAAASDAAAAAHGVTLLAAPNPRLAFLRAVAACFAPEPPRGIHPTAIIHPSARIAADVFVGPYTVIDEECEVGEGTVIHSHVHLYAGVRVGRRVLIHSGTAIGADGYGYERNEHGALEKFPHLGGVVIEDDVEIGSNTSIDRGTLADTRIKTGARIDNQVHIAHNVTIGAHAAVIAQSMIGGGVVIGDGAWIAPAAAIMNQVPVGDGATVGLGAVVVKPVAARETVMGAPAVPSDRFRRQQAALKGLTGE